VKERTLEVIRQKEQIEKTFEDTRTLSKIGNDITSTLSVEDIIDKVYSKVNTLMDAVGFGVGLYNNDTGKIIFPLYIEGEEKFSSITYDISEKDKLTNICYSQNREILINDFFNEIESLVGKVQSPVVGKVVQSIIYLPMTLKERVIGVITVQSFNKNAYTDYHVQILKNLAVYVAIAVDNASLYQNLEDRVIERTAEVTTQKELIEKTLEDVRLSAQIAKDIASSLSVETIVSRVYENVRKIVKAESFGIGLYQPQSNTILFSGFIEKGEKLDDVHISLNDKERYAVMTFERDIEVIINDHEKEFIKYTKDLKKPIVGEIPASLVYLPLYTKEKKIGVLTAQCFTKNAFQDFQVNILKNMALSIAIALDNANLYQNLEEKVKERTVEVQKQKAIIEEKNKDITDSIRYAKKIQQAIAPEIDKFNKNFDESFILYKPKDIVSGDFYWFEHFENTTVFAAADCTGHGVPGAFMSLICSDIMFKVIGDKKIFNPGEALNHIDEKLVRLIKKSSESSANDGMDIALCTYHKDSKKLLYAGAHRPLLHVRNGEMFEYKPSKFSIGGHSTEGKKFEQIEIDVKPGDIFYMLTDGYADQFGGDEGKKFKFKNFKQLVLDISGKPLKDQRNVLDERFEAWKGSLEQIDDVCVIGIKI
jgi:transcriptional regulator with GAF, ATPase, and Fis domain